MNGGNVPLSDTQDRLFFLLYLSPPSWVSLVSLPAYLSCVSSLPACLSLAALLCLSFSVVFYSVLLCFSVVFLLVSFLSFIVLLCFFAVFLLCLCFLGSLLLSFMSWTPFLHVRAARRCIESGTTYRQLVDHQLHVVLPARLDRIGASARSG